jgi:hypothetical protein
MLLKYGHGGGIRTHDSQHRVQIPDSKSGEDNQTPPLHDKIGCPTANRTQIKRFKAFYNNRYTIGQV